MLDDGLPFQYSQVWRCRLYARPAARPLVPPGAITDTPLQFTCHVRSHGRGGTLVLAYAGSANTSNQLRCVIGVVGSMDSLGMAPVMRTGWYLACMYHTGCNFNVDHNVIASAACSSITVSFAEVLCSFTVSMCTVNTETWPSLVAIECGADQIGHCPEQLPKRRLTWFRLPTQSGPVYM